MPPLAEHPAYEGPALMSLTPINAPFPATRLRRLRRTPALRGLAAENVLSVTDLIWPIFVMEGDNDAHPIPSMPGVSRLTIDRAVEAAKEVRDLGIPAICIFPYVLVE